MEKRDESVNKIVFILKENQTDESHFQKRINLNDDYRRIIDMHG